MKFRKNRNQTYLRILRCLIMAQVPNDIKRNGMKNLRNIRAWDIRTEHLIIFLTCRGTDAENLDEIQVIENEYNSLE